MAGEAATIQLGPATSAAERAVSARSRSRRSSATDYRELNSLSLERASACSHAGCEAHIAQALAFEPPSAAAHAISIRAILTAVISTRVIQTVRLPLAQGSERGAQ